MSLRKIDKLKSSLKFNKIKSIDIVSLPNRTPYLLCTSPVHLHFLSLSPEKGQKTGNRSRNECKKICERYSRLRLFPFAL